MNAVQHAQTEFGVQLELTGTDLCVEVSDSCSGNPDLQPRPPASLAHGRGLLLVHRLSDQWGVTRSHTRAGKTVWFRVSLSHHLVTAGT
jgi:anti-sigma regulatory factor (Ser/Thr protein kinase)